MYAAVVNLTIDPAIASAAASAFTTEVLPRIKSAPGFLGGYWLDPVDGKGFGLVLFEAEQQARHAVPPTISWSAPGVEITGVDVRHVAVALPQTSA